MRRVIIGLLKFYQKHISHFWGLKGVHCKYYPTCSEYMKQAVIKYGTFKGIFLGIKRILRCNPFSKGGYDPLK